MEIKPELIFTFPAAMGGVASFNYNIINNSGLRNNFITRVIMLKADEDSRADFKESFDVDECITFHYSDKENQYYVLKRLENLIGKAAGALVCDNDKSLLACNLFNNPKTVFHLLHDYFYVNQHIAHAALIDVAVAHSSFYSDCLFADNSKDFAHHSFYIPYGVKQYKEKPPKENGRKLKLFFLGRLAESKGVHKLLEIDNLLIKNNVFVDWTIIGKGPLKDSLLNDWEGKSNVQFESPETTDDVYKLLQMQDGFIFLTEFEGTPVSIMESMANGCVTLVNDLPGGIRDMITTDVGYRLPLNDIDKYVETIRELDQNREKLNRLQIGAWEKAKSQYDVSINADNYFNLFSRFDLLKRKRRIPESIKLSRLDKPYFPNSLVKLLRSI